MIAPFISLLLLAVAGAPALAYDQDEHERIGRDSYVAACEHLSDDASPWDPPGQAERLALVCGHVDTQAELFGQMTALAGDFARSPDELRTAEGRRRLNSVQHFLWLALGNDAHFFPEAPRVWAQWHQVALDEALQAASEDGLQRVATIDDAVLVMAFGAHFLHDSHASGHMGIDRASSSAGASHTFHDYWNRKGRTVRDRLGEQWVTFGDGQLGKEAAAPGQGRMMETATMAIEDVLRTFVEGQPDPSRQVQVWERLPYELVDASTFFVQGVLLPSVQVPRDAIEPVDAFRRPARVSLAFETWFTTNRVVTDKDKIEPLSGMLVGAGFAFPIESVPMRAYAGVGVGRSGGGGGALVGLGYILPLGRSVMGAWEHDLLFGTDLQLGGAAPLSASSWHLGYRGQLEFGRFLLRGSAGPALIYPSEWLQLGEGAVGWYLTFGAGVVLGVSSSGRI